MLISENTLFDFDDISIMPSNISFVDSRSECQTKRDSSYPIFASPMGAVIDEVNYKTFQNAGIHTVIPRNVAYKTRVSLMYDTFVAFSLEEANKLFLKRKSYKHPASLLSPSEFKGVCYICIDVANGHMNQLLDTIKTIKNNWNDQVIVMAGNIANPNTYREYCRIGCDYIRVGIGSGSRCTTSINTGVHYPLASLLDRIFPIKREITNLVKNWDEKKTPSGYRDYKKVTKIIADGGIRNYSDIIKSLCLGADYVMIGKQFAMCYEACGKIFKYNKGKAHPYLDSKYLKEYIETIGEPGPDWYRNYYGMSTTKAQNEIALASENSEYKIINRIPEGFKENVKVTTTLSKWCKEFNAALASAMSYIGITSLDDIAANSNIVKISSSSFVHFTKKY